ncbi:MAG TPA: hypothetical protein VIY52_19655 [Streptosporangiaceae bacterium]
MPSHDARHVSRRSLLQGAATAGAAGLAATALGAAVSPAAASESAPRAGGSAKAASGPLVVHVRDARSGDIEVFSGTSQIRLRDKDLAARISRAAG